MDLTVLERQRAVLQRLHHQSTHSWPQTQDNHHFDAVWPSRSQVATTSPDFDQMRSLSVVSNSNNSSVTGAPVPKPHQQCNSSLETPIIPNFSSSLKKRKAEFDGAEDIKEEGLKSEEFGEEKSEVTVKTDGELSSNTCSKVSVVQKPDYIHVRARRGQATDSHSLAERARREKISKKMKCLQDLVPGCNKVIGKAGMLDEIINYVQSLQKQVEFLSLKLATINPRLDFSIDNFLAKEIPAYLATLQPAAAQFDDTSSMCFQYPMQQGTLNFTTDMPIDQSQVQPQKAGPSSAPIPGPFLDPSCITQQMSGWESDWPSPFISGFH